ncbi:MAG: DUF4173 domain-containing protein [Elusimicrobia bacterium]|nr:DUF4173 domain-containing protein [Elusimicrobiota bacterium]
MIAITADAARTETAVQDGPTLAAMGAAVGLGAAFDYLFYGRPLGISVPLFALAVVLLAARVARLQARELSRGQTAAAAGALVFASFSAWRAAPELIFANVCAASYLLALFLAPWLSGRRLGDYDGRDFFTGPGGVVAASLGNGKREFENLDAWISSSMNLRGTATGVLIALPFLGFFLSLMMSADAVFRRALERVLGELAPISLVAQAFCVAAVAIAALGVRAFLRARPTPSTRSGWAELARDGARAWGFVEASTSATLVNALFALFSAFQLYFLLSAKSLIEGANTGVTYASSAHEGFWQLVVIGASSLALALAFDERAAADSPRRSRVKKAHVVAASVFTGVMLASAAYRLALYEEAYGFTVLRFYSHTFTAYIAVLFLLLGRKSLLGKPLSEFLRHAVVASFGCLAAWNVANPHRLIAAENVDRSASKPIDAWTLAGLSNDAAEELVRAVPLIADAEARGRLAEDLLRRIDTHGVQAERGSWPGFHVGDARAAAVFAREQASLVPYRVELEKLRAERERKWREEAEASRQPKIRLEAVEGHDD